VAAAVQRAAPEQQEQAVLAVLVAVVEGLVMVLPIIPQQERQTQAEAEAVDTQEPTHTVRQAGLD
jgi:uncharacterized protein YjeT (DUF2065 family)